MGGDSIRVLSRHKNCSIGVLGVRQDFDVMTGPFQSLGHGVSRRPVRLWSNPNTMELAIPCHDLAQEGCMALLAQLGR